MDDDTYSAARVACLQLGYTPRDGQSDVLLGAVPAAVIQEARDGCLGDARSLLTRLLIARGVEPDTKRSK